MELRNIILFTIARFTLSYARYGKPRNGYDVMQLHAHIWKGLLSQSITASRIMKLLKKIGVEIKETLLL